MPSLVEALGLKPPQQQRLGKLLGRIKSVAKFLEDALPKAEKHGLVKAIEAALPWAGALGTALSEAAPPVKFVITLFEKLTEINDPAALAYLACTLAYQRSVEQAAQALDLPAPPARKVSSTLEDTATDGAAAGVIPFCLAGFSYGQALQHPFVIESDRILARFAAALGYSDDQQRRLLNEVHARFVTHLKTILCSRDSAPKFAPLKERMEIGTGDLAAYEALAEHAEYQRWLFEERPVFGKEPFTLAQVYVDIDCGVLRWEEIQGDVQMGTAPSPSLTTSKPMRLDPFQERHGGRQPLAQAVLDLLASPHLEDPIVIQGAAGSGKSAFTLWLCAELVRQGLRPIRIQLRDLQIDRDRPVTEALVRAVRLTDPVDRPGSPYVRPDDLFLGGQVFNQGVFLGGITICPYVLILDGWDEISISAAEGYAQRVDRLLENLRSEYLQRRDLRPTPVRVILTGRPSAEVAQSGVLRGKTPILTPRPLRPFALQGLIAKIATAVSRNRAVAADADWKQFDTASFLPVLTRYGKDFERWTEGPRHQPEPASSASGLEVLGLPLLAHLAIRLLAERQTEIESLLSSPTALYRSLVDLTCAKAGKYADDSEEVERQYRIVGRPLRELLRYTAAAITTHGKESISYEELRLRLKHFGLDMAERVESDTARSTLSQLIVSYFFKGGHPGLGCEFLHKAFREYLFAESIVEELKAYGRAAHTGLPQRTDYWQDFPTRDPRRAWCRRLAPLLAPQWLSPEVAAHLSELLEWEIERGAASSFSQDPRSTPPLPRAGWSCVRDGLADLWDWWAEGVHLRPQPSLNRKDQVTLEPPYALDLVEWSMPLAPEPALPRPQRQTTIDSHLGDALCRLAAHVHFYIVVQDGWLSGWREHLQGSRLEPSALWQEVEAVCRRYQTTVTHSDRIFTLFAPAASAEHYFRNFAARVNSAGWRPRGCFPGACDLRGADLRLAELDLPGESISRFDFANLYRASVSGFAGGTRFPYVFAQQSTIMATLFNADFTGADFRYAYFNYAQFNDCNLAGAHLDGAFLFARSSERRGGATIGAAFEDASDAVKKEVFGEVQLAPASATDKGATQRPS